MKQTVLIADRDPCFCDLYQRFLTLHGYHVETSLDVPDCLQKLRRLEPAVLVLGQELHSRRTDGVLARLRDEGLIPGIPVLLMDTAGDVQDIEEFIGLPDVDYLPKCFSLTVLLEKVRFAAAKQGRREPLDLNRV